MESISVAEDAERSIFFGGVLASGYMTVNIIGLSQEYAHRGPLPFDRTYPPMSLGCAVPFNRQR
jgi:hypothetical protein